MVDAILIMVTTMKIVIASVFKSLARQGGRFPKRSLSLLAREWQNVLSLHVLQQSFDLLLFPRMLYEQKI